MLVRFGHPDEFVDELAREPDAVARKLVRVTQHAYPTMQGTITALDVVATAKVASGDVDFDLVIYRHRVGDLWGIPKDDEVRELANAHLEELQRKLTDAGFVVAGGVYEPEPEHAGFTVAGGAS